MPPPLDPGQRPTPVLLLKTKSAPADSYEELLSRPRGGRSLFAPRFVPVLQHMFEPGGTEKLRGLLRERRIGASRDCDFGGLIFTSQRAVEAFAQIVQAGAGNADDDDDDDDPEWPRLQHVPVYSVGPATARALGAVRQQPPLQVFGSHTGNGDALARFVLGHYAAWHGGRRDGPAELPPLLFLVGKQRRDVIPRTLMDASLPAGQRIEVVEEVVYGSGVMESFPADLAAALDATDASSSRWIVVFSPTGCDSMLRGLGLLESTGKFVPAKRGGKTLVAAIGPTTRNHLVSKFGFEPDVCAETPTPEGVLQAIMDFEAKSEGGERARMWKRAGEDREGEGQHLTLSS